MNPVFISVLCFVILLGGSWSLENSNPEGKVWVICVSGFNYFELTYGFESGIYRFCDLVGGPGYQNKIVISPDDVAYNVMNPIAGHIIQDQKQFGQDPNYYENVEITYKTDNITKEFFYDVLSGKKNGKKKVLDSGPEDTVVIFFITFGNYGLITLSNDVILEAEELVTFLEDLSDKGRFKRLLFILESSNSGSMFDGYLSTNKNILVWTNTHKHGLISFCHTNFEIAEIEMLPTSTCHSWYMVYVIERMIREGTYESTSFGDFYQIAREFLAITPFQPNLYGQLELTNLKLTDFFGTSLQPRRRPVKKEKIIKTEQTEEKSNQPESKKAIPQLIKLPTWEELLQLVNKN